MASASATISPDLLAQRFDVLRAAGRRALVPYLTAGHPDPARSLALMHGLADAGADAIEVGVPFSDPMADGPVIQGSSQQALGKGMNLDRTLEMIARAKLDIPVCSSPISTRCSPPATMCSCAPVPRAAPAFS